MAMLLRRLLQRHAADRPLGPASQQLTLTGALLRRLFAHIKSIARAVGFTGPRHFAAAFRQRVGASPSAWRGQTRHEPATEGHVHQSA
jgi:AraC-like DNA-binding protein